MFFHARRVTSEMGLSLTQEWKHVQDLRKKIKRQMLLSLLPSHIHNTSSTSPDRTYDEIYLTGRDSGDSLHPTLPMSTEPPRSEERKVLDRGLLGNRNFARRCRLRGLRG